MTGSLPKVTALPALRKLVTLLLAGSLTGLAFSQTLNSSDLLFTIDGSDLGIVPIALEPGQTDPVNYDFASGEVRLTVADTLSQTGAYSDPVFCFDLSQSVSSLPVAAMIVRDANGHDVLAGLSAGNSLSYDLANDEIRLSPQIGAKCFYRGFASGDFGLFGIAPFESQGASGSGAIFSDAFAGKTMNLAFRDVPSFVTAGGSVTYSLELSNTGSEPLENIGLQELFPANDDFFDASMDLVGWSCSGSQNCPSASLNDGGSLRFQGFNLPGGESMTFQITRNISGNSLVGAEIRLYAGSVAGDTPLNPYDAAEAGMTVVGAGDALAVSATTATAGQYSTITVTALDANQNPVPGVEVQVFNDDGLDIQPVAGTVTDVNGEVDFQATTTAAGSYQVEFDSTDAGITPGSGTVTFEAAAPDSMIAWVDVNNAVADGNDTVVIKVYVEDTYTNPVPAATVDVLDDGGLASLPLFGLTNANGIATLTATSEVATSHTIELGIAGVGSESVIVDFVAGTPADFAFMQGPFDTPQDGVMSPDVIVRVVDGNGNWVADENTIEITMQLRQGSGTVDGAIQILTVENGEAAFNNIDLSGVPAGTYYLRAFGTYEGNPLFENSGTFEILPAPPPDSLAMTLTGFDAAYSQGAQAMGTETVGFVYAEGAGDIEQLYNVFRVLDSDGLEIDAATYDALFVSVAYGPAGYEDYIRPLSGSSAANVVAPETVDVTVDFELEANAPLGDYTLTLTSYDVTGEDPEDVSLGNADNGDYEILAAASQDISVVSVP